MAETKMQLVDWLDDLCVRFIINLPHEELTSVERICFQIEEAQWFYEDFIRAQDPALPHMNLRRFCELIFQHCPLLAPFQASAALSYAEFLAYKTRVPVRGAILLNADLTEVVLVKGWKKNAKWSFPRGKINKEERDLDCAVREVYEETGYDVKEAGLIDDYDDDTNVKYIDMALREQQMRLYVFRDVPMDTVFEPKTRKEISKIGWFKVADLAATGNQKNSNNNNNNNSNQQQQYAPAVSQDALKASQFYMVAPFIRPLRQWIKQQRKLDQQQGGRRAQKAAAAAMVEESEVENLQVPNQMLYDDGMMTTDAEDDGHFKRLLSGLQVAQQQPALPLPLALPEQVASVPQPAAASTADLSAQLKAMLSVGGPVAAAPPSVQQQPHPPPQPQPQAHANPLMSMLLGKPQMQHDQMPLPLPHTPMEQITSTPPQARTPHHHHHHPRPPPYSEMPPPPVFPLSPPHAQHGHPLPSHLQFHEPPPPHWHGQPMPPQPFHGQQMPPPQPPMHQQGHYGGPPPQMPGPQSRGLFGSNIPAPPPTQISNPLQTGDPAFRSQFPQYNQAAPAPPMPKPAPQKLTNHAMNLLNVFKSPDATHVQPAQASPAHLPELADQTKPILPSQLLGGAGPIEPQQQAPMRDPQRTPEIHQPRAQRSRNAHQDSLLNLFKSAATPVVQQPQAHRPPPLPSAGLTASSAAAAGGEPVELAAQPSPHMPRETAKPVSHKLSMRRLPNVNTTDLPPTRSPHLTSATVSGPLNAPDFETAKKHKPVELGNGVASPSPRTVGAGFTIMQRPSSSGRRSGAAGATPPVPLPGIGTVPVHLVGQTLAMEAPRPRQPTSILRRGEAEVLDMMSASTRQGQVGGAARGTPPAPQPQLQPQAAPLPPHPTSQLQQKTRNTQQAHQSFDRRESATAQHKNALLGLFAAAATTAPPHTSSTILPGQQSQRSPAEFPGSLPTSAPSGIASSHARASGIGSPVSPLPSSQLNSAAATAAAATAAATSGANPNVLTSSGLVSAKRQDTGGSAISAIERQIHDTPRSSRISSINSVPGDVLFPTSAGAGSGPGAAASMILGNMPLTSAPGNIPPPPQQSQQTDHAAAMLNLFKNAGLPTTTTTTTTSTAISPPVSGAVSSSIMTGSRKGSIQQQQEGMGATSPITPVEKNFLMGLLEKTVLEGRERARAGR